MSRVLLLGGTGLVGASVLDRLLAQDDDATVTAVVRRPLDRAHPRLRTLVTGLDRMDAYAQEFAVDTVFCCLGSTLRQAGSRDAFYRVDHDYCVEAATLARRQGVSRFVLVSAVNANPEGRFFYARVKGETERDIEALGFPSLILVQPSLLDGERKESRPAERLGQLAMGLVKPLAGWTRADWLPVAATDVAAAMVAASRDTALSGVTRLRYRQILDHAHRQPPTSKE